MFCFQCEQTSRGTGCTVYSICGKDEHTAILQDVLVHAAKGIAQYNHRTRQLGTSDRAIDRFIIEALFATVTNVNFDAAAIERMIRKAAGVRDKAPGALRIRRPKDRPNARATARRGNLDARGHTRRIGRPRPGGFHPVAARPIRP